MHTHAHQPPGRALTPSFAALQNEPDLNAPCINGTTWIEHVTLRSQAIQNAYADFNADVTASLRACRSLFGLKY